MAGEPIDKVELVEGQVVEGGIAQPEVVRDNIVATLREFMGIARLDTYFY